jgi:hypothetical protein
MCIFYNQTGASILKLERKKERGKKGGKEEGRKEERKEGRKEKPLATSLGVSSHLCNTIVPNIIDLFWLCYTHLSDWFPTVM